jgi:hypothetical protein
MPFHNPYHFVPVKTRNGTDDVSSDAIRSNGYDPESPASHITHNRYVAGTNSGRVVCRLTAVTPFFVGDKRSREATEQQSALVEPFTSLESGASLKNWRGDSSVSAPAIPATTLRGLISGTIEAASNSALRVLGNRTYSYRKRATPREPLSSMGMVIGTEGKFRVMPLRAYKVRLSNASGFQTFSEAAPRFYYLRTRVNGREPDWEPTIDPNPIYEPDLISEAEFLLRTSVEQAEYVRGIVRIMWAEDRDLPDTRKNELFIPFSDKAEECLKGDRNNKWPTFSIGAAARTLFEELADERTQASEPKEGEQYGEGTVMPYEPIGTKRNSSGRDGYKFRLKRGDLVYFRWPENNGETISEIALSSIWRGRVNDRAEPARTFDFFSEIDNELLPFNHERRVITPAEQMFGFVEDNEPMSRKPRADHSELSLAGRLYPSNARFVGIRKAGGGAWQPLQSKNDLFDHECTLRILASPKPPSPAMYFRRITGEGYVAKHELKLKEHRPQGRKMYLHHPPSTTQRWVTNDPATFSKQKVTIQPFKAGSVFYFHFDFENLTDRELGALLYSLEPTPEFHHKLGMGKPIGLGSVKLEIAGLFLVNRTERYTESGFRAPRYAWTWKMDGFDKEAPETLYESEIRAMGARLVRPIESLHGEFRLSMDTEIRSALELLGRRAVRNGELDSLAGPVHTPLAVGQEGSPELETYKWFVNNDLPKQSSRQYLKPIGDQTILPKLKENVEVK